MPFRLLKAAVGCGFRCANILLPCCPALRTCQFSAFIPARRLCVPPPASEYDETWPAEQNCSAALQGSGTRCHRPRSGKPTRREIGFECVAKNICPLTRQSGTLDTRQRGT